MLLRRLDTNTSLERGDDFHRHGFFSLKLKTLIQMLVLLFGFSEFSAG